MHDLSNIHMQVAAFWKVHKLLKLLRLLFSPHEEKCPAWQGIRSSHASNHVPLAVQPFGE
jgi:hypothetical protein